MCQKTKPTNRKEITDIIPISGLFNTWSIDFAGPLPNTRKGNRYFIIGVEHVSKWPVARSIPPSLFNAKGVIGFIQDEIIKPFRSPVHILSDNDLKFDCAALHGFASKHDIDWKRTATYNPMGNGIARRTVGTVKRAMQRMMRTEDIEWDACIDSVLYGYRRRL